MPVAAPTLADPRPLVLHVVYRFDVGGLENGIVNLINHMPLNSYRHAVVALTDVASTFSRRIRRDDVTFVSLGKPAGHLVSFYPRLVRMLREMKPAIVHTRNLAALECQVPAWLARVPVRIHGEHGRDVDDIDGDRYQWVRRGYRPFVHHYVALSRDLDQYLCDKVRVPRKRRTQIYNGVDSDLFHPEQGAATPIPGCPFSLPEQWLVGTVGRMQAVKDQTRLAQAFVRALDMAPGLRARLRLVMVGDGPLRAQAQQILESAGVQALAWLPGERHDVAQVMRGLDCFALPSLAEGISNTILEAMASGLPVVATNVGGNADLVRHGVTGEIVPAADVDALAHSLVRMATDPERARAMGAAGRKDAEASFSMRAMVSTYQDLYDAQLLAQRKDRRIH